MRIRPHPAGILADVPNRMKLLLIPFIVFTKQRKRFILIDMVLFCLAIKRELKMSFDYLLQTLCDLWYHLVHRLKQYAIL